MIFRVPPAISKLTRALERHAPRLALALILLVVLAGSLYSLYLGDQLRFLPDEADYLALVDNLVQKGRYSLDGSTPSAYRAPGYPFWLLPFRAIGAGVAGLRWSNFLAYGLTLAGLYLLLGRLQGRAAGFLAVLLACCYPVLFYTAGTLYPQTLAGMLFVWVLYLLADERVMVWRMAAAGLLLGWLVLTAPVFAFTLPVLGLWLLVKRPRHALAHLGWFLGVAALVLGAWTLRNWLVFDVFIPVATNSGENLLVGNSARTAANAGRSVSFGDYAELTEEMSEIERDSFYRQEALGYIRSNPGAAARLYLEKVLNYFNYRNELVTQLGGMSLANLAMLLTYGPLLLLGLARLVLAGRYPLSNFEWLLVSVYLLSALTSAVFFTRIRFRLPFDYALILLDAIFLERMMRKLPAADAARLPA
jgi:4-amino-4-deoxy-L-arabinose transferase-like glycosyltransferase